MKRVLFVTLAALILALPAAHAERYMVLREQVTIASAPGDDMRPKIVGTVVAVDAAGVTLEGGARVPAAGAQLGETATFVCKAIDEGSPPTSHDCEAVRSDKASPKSGAVDLW